ncbi:C-OmpA-like family protein CmpA [Legionella sp. km772]|uniref:C-OmpA-like family protein CmpA n=1 Tax=Legionella sp. km772 TaxID=2498111 RepID=UPI000F8E13FC|nr:C-OmpA-like family protein CmpA [Legionella sp. km772]RUR13750.1 OmpA family protein [Legionella sp. km772]
MVGNTTRSKFIITGLMIGLLSSCGVHPPYNNFKPDNRMGRTAAAGAASGSVVGAITSGTLTGTLAGGAVGGTIGTIRAIYKDSKPAIVKQLKKESIQFVEYGDTMTLIIPTDKYFMFMSPRLNELCYPGLMNVVKLLKLYPQSPIYVAGFTDNVGSRRHKKLMSQAQAETMMTYLWANGIRSIQLKAEGYGDKNTIGDNMVVHGSAYNRRIEIQWFTGLVAKADQPILDMK